MPIPRRTAAYKRFQPYRLRQKRKKAQKLEIEPGDKLFFSQP